MKHLVLTLTLTMCLAPFVWVSGQNNNPDLRFQRENQQYTGPPVASSANFVGTWVGPDQLCMNQIQDYAVIPNPGNTDEYEYTWTLPTTGGFTVSNGLNQAFVRLRFFRGGTYTLKATLINKHSGRLQDFYKTVQVPNPTGTIVKEACGTDPSLGLNWEFTLSKSGMTGITNVQWSSNQPIQFLNTSFNAATVNPVITGTFDVHAAITHDCGVLHVSETYSTTECEGVFFRQAVEASSSSTRAVHLNRGDILPLQSLDGGVSEIIIQNHLGQQIKQMQIEGSYRLSTADMAAGMYFIRVYTPSSSRIERIRLLIR